MAFDVNTITYTGARLLVQATISDRLVISGCGVTDTIMTTTDAQYVEDFAGPMYTDNAEISGTTTNHVIFRATFPASSVYGGDHHSLILYGHLESESASVKHAIAVISAIEPFHLPTPTDVVSMFEALFTLQYAVTDGVITTQTTALETSKAEFDVLEARVVTTHIAGDDTTGEDQIIRGKKKFYDQLICEGFFTSNNGAHFGDNVTSKGDFIMSANLYPGEQSTAYVGTAEKAFTGGYFNNLYVNENGVFEVSGNTKIKGVATFNRMVVFSGEVSIDNDLECTDVNVSGNLSVSGTTTVDGIALLKNNVRISGDSTVTGTLAVNGVITANSGITGNLNGLIPFPTSALDTVPIGSIVLLRILYQSQQSGVQQYGATLTTDNPSYTLGVSCFSDTGINANNVTALASGQTFRTLSGSVFSGSQVSHALAIRVS